MFSQQTWPLDGFILWGNLKKYDGGLNARKIKEIEDDEGQEKWEKSCWTSSQSTNNKGWWWVKERKNERDISPEQSDKRGM